MKEKVICARENVESFKKELKTALPGSFDLITALYKAGMIKGLRGITLSYLTPEELENTETAAETPEQQHHCHECTAYQQDSVGDGTGIGQCTEKIITKRSKYPMTHACEHYQEK